MEEHTIPPWMLLTKRVKWDVFLSFRGEDTRNTITESLYKELESNGVRVFLDNKGMEKGDMIDPSLEEAIIDSALSVAIISPRYADSRWCLAELTRILDSGKRVIPVFYRVDPSDIRRQNGEFGNGFRSMIDLKKPSQCMVETWERALNRVGNISGYSCHSPSDEPEVVQRIVKQVSGELKNCPEYVAKFTVGLESRVDSVLEKLEIHSPGILFLGIHGTPGVGKTTLAKAVFNKLTANFEKRCFIANVREQLASEGGVLRVQNKLLSDLSSSVRPLDQESDAKRAIEHFANENRVLVVLDDVSEEGQLETLGIVRGRFQGGGRVIATSRNKGALVHCELYEAEKLTDSESLELFSIHALGRRAPTQEYLAMSKEIVDITGGLPLALEVFGSSLIKKTLREWNDSLIKLKEFRPDGLQGVLEISYDTLDDDEKIVFLDISCLLLQTDMKREEVVDILEGCGLKAELAIGNLITKSLLKIIGDNLWMHDQIRDMGRQIVRQECFDECGKRSRLWDPSDIRHTLRHDKATEAIRGIVMNFPKPPALTNEMLSWVDFCRHPTVTTGFGYLAEKIKSIIWHRTDDNDIDKSFLCTKLFEKMVNLKLLQINHAKVVGDFRYLPSELRWLKWSGCSLKVLPANVPEELRVLDLSESTIVRLWPSGWSVYGFNKVAEKLVTINLYGCSMLTELPDMSRHTQLRKLTLERCVRLEKIHDSIGNMSSLVHLNLRNCSKLVDFSRDVTGMKGLQELILSHCPKFKGLPHDVRSMKSLMQLHLDGTPIEELPEYLFQLTELKMLSLDWCEKLTSLPEWLGCLCSLKELSLNGTNLTQLPESVGSLINLEKLSAINCRLLSRIPDSTGNLKSLAELRLYGSSIEQIPDSVCSISCLKVLSVGKCRSLVMLPVAVQGLASLVELELDGIPMIRLPDEICSLKFIKKLQMNNCSRLEQLPTLLGNMSSLSNLFLIGAAITELPESIGELDNLSWLNLNKCTNLRSLPDSFGKLRSLCVLTMEETSVTCLPESFGLLERLVELKLKKKLPLPQSALTDNSKLPELPASFCQLSCLEEFNARACGLSGKIDDSFTMLSKLQTLDLGYNSFHSLPDTLKDLCILKKLLLPHCTELRALPELPSSLVELHAINCYALERIPDFSELGSLQELQLPNCLKIGDVPGLEGLKSLRRLFLGGCKAAAATVKKRLKKDPLRNLNNLSLPGTEIPDWFSQDPVTFESRPNLAIKNVLVAVVVSVNYEMLDAIRAQLPSIVDIVAKILRKDEAIFTTTLNLIGVSIDIDEQFYLCRFKDYHPLVTMLKEGDTIQVGLKSSAVNGVELKQRGLYLVFENEDDFDGDELNFPFDNSQQSVSQRLAEFFQCMR